MGRKVKCYFLFTLFLTYQSSIPIYIVSDQNQEFFAGFRLLKAGRRVCLYFQLHMEARKLSSLIPRFVVNNSYSNYNNLTESEESRESQDLSARSQSRFYYQTSTNCSGMKTELDQIKGELQHINKSLNQIVGRLGLLDRRVERLQRKGRQGVQNPFIIEGYPSIKLQKILERQLILLEKARQLSRPIRVFIRSAQTNLQMVSFYVFYRISKWYPTYDDQMLFKFIQNAFREQRSAAQLLEIQQLKETVSGKKCFNMVGIARKDYRKFKRDPNLMYRTYNLEEWVLILEKEIDMQLPLDNDRTARFRKMMIFAISDQNLLNLCKSVNKYIQLLCFAKHYFFGQARTHDIGRKLKLSEQEFSVVKDITEVLEKFMTGA